jgi:hypothetical protein
MSTAANQQPRCRRVDCAVTLPFNLAPRTYGFYNLELHEIRRVPVITVLMDLRHWLI